jgi:DNA-binding NtrC family response regulator
MLDNMADAIDVVDELFNAYVATPFQPWADAARQVDLKIGLKTSDDERALVRGLDTVGLEDAAQRVQVRRYAWLALATRRVFDSLKRLSPVRLASVPKMDEIFDATVSVEDRIAIERSALRVAHTLFATLEIAGQSEAAVALRRMTYSVALGGEPYVLEEYEETLQQHPVVILGETGSGKELVASAMLAGAPLVFDDRYKEGRRYTVRPTEAINLAGMPPDLMYSELFGHAKGAFTGATKERRGLFERTHGGVAFVDEIAELTGVAQASLLRVLETGRARHLGGETEVDARPRVVVATHVDLEARVGMGDGRFREDLLARLAGAVIRVPPLRDRGDDIKTIALALLDRLPLATARLVVARERTLAYLDHPSAKARTWARNVRELAQTVRAIALGVDVPPMTARSAESAVVPDEIRECTWTMDEVERWYVERAVAKHGSRRAVGERLGLNRNTVARILRRSRE